MSSYDDILSKLKDYVNADYVPMHMPGTKRNGTIIGMDSPYEIDITEIDGFDNMHNPEGLIKNAFERASRLYGAKKSLYLVNGSTAGILAAISGVTHKNDKVLVARNCHISVYNAININELEPIYIVPEYDKINGIFKGITLNDIKDNIEKNVGNILDIKAVIITSPTYEGNVSEVEKIAEYLHEYNIPLVVDEAHGAHFVFDDRFPRSAIACGADVVINSVHKTLPALTQTALLHINGDLVDYERIERFWNIYQTTSPSYILMSSIDRCMSIIEQDIQKDIQKDGNRLFDIYIDKLQVLRNRLSQLKNISLVNTDDISKIVLKCSNGKALSEYLLKHYRIQVEMSSFKYIIAMTSVADFAEYYDKFADALEEIDRNYQDIICNLSIDDLDNESEIVDDKSEIVDNESEIVDDKSEIVDDKLELIDNKLELIDNKLQTIIEKIGQSKAVMKPSDAYIKYECSGGEENSIQAADICGKISVSPVLIYPPGMPVVNSGEVLTEDNVNIIRFACKAGLEVIGLKEGKILCLK